MYKQLLFMRWIVFNALVVVAASLAWRYGFIKDAFDKDASGLVEVIIGVAVLAWLGVGARIVYVCRELDKNWVSKNHPASRDSGSREALAVKFASRIRPFEWLSYTCVTLGFLGTVWGFKIALSGVSVSGAVNVNSIAPMVEALVTGMGVALWTTIVGIVCSMVVSFNVRILEGGFDRLFCKMVGTAT